MSNLDFFPQFESDSIEVLSLSIILATIVYLIPVLIYPFKLLSVMIHELGHVFAARFTRTELEGFWVFEKTGGGETRKTEASSWDPLIAFPAGYLGVPVFAAGLILLTGLPLFAAYSLVIIGSLLLFLVFLYGRQYEIDERKPVTGMVGVGFGVALIGIGWLLPRNWAVLTLYTIAILVAILSINDFLILARVARSSHNSDDDASKMAAYAKGCLPVVGKGCTATFWVLAWAILSILLIGAAIWFTWLRNWPGAG